MGTLILEDALQKIVHRDNTKRNFKVSKHDRMIPLGTIVALVISRPTLHLMRGLR